MMVQSVSHFVLGRPKGPFLFSAEFPVSKKRNDSSPDSTSKRTSTFMAEDMAKSQERKRLMVAV
jgi:hypothetical protein